MWLLVPILFIAGLGLIANGARRRPGIADDAAVAAGVAMLFGSFILNALLA